jgi:hypothetical protein
MSNQLEMSCQDHPNLEDCPDSLIAGLRSRKFGIRIHDGGSSVILIKFCPWCGTRLGRKRADGASKRKVVAKPENKRSKRRKGRKLK